MSETNKRLPRRRPLSLSPLRALKGTHITADTLVINLTGTTCGDNASSGSPATGAVADAAAPATPAVTGKMVLLIGLPASGKSTICEAFEKAGWVRINKDALRKELYGDESVLGDARKVSALFYTRLEEALKNGRNVLIDNTNVAVSHRKGPIERARNAGYKEITHIFLDVPIDECIRRNSLRDRKVPEEGMRQLAKLLAGKGGVPSPSEGALIVVKPGRTIGEFLLAKVRNAGPRKPAESKKSGASQTTAESPKTGDPKTGESQS